MVSQDTVNDYLYNASDAIEAATDTIAGMMRRAKEDGRLDDHLILLEQLRQLRAINKNINSLIF